MTEEECWEIVTKTPGETDSYRVQHIFRELRQKAPADLIDFEMFIGRQLRVLHSGALWRAAYLMCGGCSDDGFGDFKGWMLLRGRDFCSRCANDPEELSTVEFGPEEYPACPEVSQAAAIIYQEKYGQKIPAQWVGYPPIPERELSGFGEPAKMAASLPRLWRRWGEECL